MNKKIFPIIIATAAVIALLSTTSSSFVHAIVVGDDGDVNLTICRDNVCIDTDCEVGQNQPGLCIPISEELGGGTVTCDMSPSRTCLQGIVHYGGDSGNNCALDAPGGRTLNITIACGSCFSMLGDHFFNVSCDATTGAVSFTEVTVDFGVQYDCSHGNLGPTVPTPLDTCTNFAANHYFELKKNPVSCQVATVAEYSDPACTTLAALATIPINTCSARIIAGGCPMITTMAPPTTSTLPTTSTTTTTTTTLPTSSSTTGAATSSSTTTTGGGSGTTGSPIVSSSTTTTLVTSTTSNSIGSTTVAPPPTPPPTTTSSSAPAPTTTTTLFTDPASASRTCASDSTSLTVNGISVNFAQIPLSTLRNMKQENVDDKSYVFVADLCNAVTTSPDGFAQCSTGSPSASSWFLQLFDSDQKCTDATFDFISSQPAVSSDMKSVVIELKNYARGMRAVVTVGCDSKGEMALGSESYRFSIDGDKTADGFTTYRFSLVSTAICGATTAAAGTSTSAAPSTGNSTSDDDGNKEIIVIASAGGAAFLLLVGGVCFFIRRSRNAADGGRNSQRFDPSFPDDKSLLQNPTPRTEDGLQTSEAMET